MAGLVFASWLLLSLSGPEEGPPPATGANEKDGATDLGLPARFFPIESRTDFANYVGNYVPGATNSATGALRMAGARDTDAAAFVDGYRMRRLTLPLGMFASAEALSAGYGAEYSDVAGGVLRFETRAGSDRFSTDVDAYYETAQSAHFWAVAPTVSGPIVPGHLSFAIGGLFDGFLGEDLADPTGFVGNSAGLRTRALSGALRLSWQIAPGQVIDSLTVLGGGDSKGGNPLGLDPEAGSRVFNQDTFTGLRWRGRLAEAITARLQVSGQNGHLELAPSSCDTDPTGCDFTPSVINTYPRMIQTGNATEHDHFRDRDFEMAGALEARLPTLPGVEQRLRVTARWRSTELEVQELAPGDSQYVYHGTDRVSLTRYYGNDPWLDSPAGGWFKSRGSSLSAVHSVEDQLRIAGRLWVVPGLAVVTANVRSDSADVDDAVVTPRLGLALDFLGDGRFWLRASTSRRALRDAERMIGFLTSTRASLNCRWNPDTQQYDQSCLRSGGLGSISLGRPCGTGANSDGTACSGSVSILPLAWENTAALSGLLPGALTAALTFVYRRSSRETLVTEENQIWSGSGRDVIGYRNGRPVAVNDWSSDPRQATRYIGLTASVERNAGPLHAWVAYTFNGVRQERSSGLSHLVADDPDYSGGAFRALARYDTGYASGALAFAWNSSRPGSSTGDQHLNLQMRAHLKRLIRVDADLYSEVMNLVHSTNPQTQLDLKVWRIGTQFWY